MSNTPAPSEQPFHGSAFLIDDVATAHVGQRLATALTTGDTVLLFGNMGVGKTAMARALIQRRLLRDGYVVEDVPSPTFTLVQTYGADVPIWHADLYRLSDPAEISELGLDEAFETAITLVEWPDRLGYMMPPRRLELLLDFAAPTGRQVHWRMVGGRWEHVEAVLKGAAGDE